MIVYLKPQAPFSQSVPRSDTLFGAVAWAIRLLYGESELIALLDQFDRAIESDSPPPFVLSSLFPYFEDGNGKVRFLPRPLRLPARLTLSSPRDHQLVKKLKKAAWVSEPVFDLLANGELAENHLFSELRQGESSRFRLHAGALMVQEEFELGANAPRVRMLSSLYRYGETARNAINRLTLSTGDGGGQLFYTPIVSARTLPESIAHTGFYCRIRVAELMSVSVVEKLKAAFRFLGEKGFGGDFSVGRGHCHIAFEQADELGASGGERLVSLSLLHPNANDRRHFAEHGQSVLARLERRKGFLESAFAVPTTKVWKPTLVMLGEGASFPKDQMRQLYGSLSGNEEREQELGFNLRINGLGYVVPTKEAVS